VRASELDVGRRGPVVVVAWLFAAVLLGGTVPSPLYPCYVAALGLTPLLVTVVYAVYALGTLAALLLFGGLSDRVGRRPVLTLAVGVAVVSSLVFLLWQSLPGLLVGRVLSGFSVGLTTGTATAALAELHPDRRTATTLATVANMGGLGLGPVVAGVIATHLAGPTTTPYLVHLALLAPVIALLVVPETGPRRATGAVDALRAVRPQRLAVPHGAGAPFAAAALAGFTAFALLGLFTALTASFLGSVRDDPSPQTVGIVITVVFAAAVTAQLTAQRTSPHRAVLVGVGLLPVGAALVALAVAGGSLALFVGAGVIGGIGIGAAFQAALVRVGGLAAPEDRAAVTSAFFVMTYLGITLPVVGVGQLATVTSLTMASLALAVLVTLLAALCVLLTVRQRQAVAP
jgi:predicted MFS family arabinose efflux permease